MPRLPMPMPFTAPALQATPHAGADAAPVARKARFWDRIAPKYAAEPIADMAGYEATLQRVQALLPPDAHVLEVGCGTGSTAMRLAPFTGSMLATDVAPGMIAIARQRLAAQPVPQLGFAVADADAPGLGQGTYDVVLAFSMLHLVDDLDHALELLVQALRPGGLLISKTPCINEMNPLIPRLALPLMQAIGKAPQVLCFDAQHLRSALVRRGLEVVSVERHGTRGKDIRVFIVARKPG